MSDVSRLGSAVPLIGREAELAVVRAGLRRADAAEAGAVLLGGEAGVGKSRLLRELTDDAVRAGALVLTGRCVDIGEAGVPYLAFAEALGGLAGEELAAARRRPALGRVLPAIGIPERPRPDPVGDRATPGARPEQDIGQLQLFEAVLGLLGELSARRTLVLALEDLHWADSSTRNLFSLLVSRLRSGELAGNGAGRLLLVGTYRSDDLHRRHPLRPLLAELLRLPVVERLELAPLADDDTLRLVTALGDVPADVARRLAGRAEGNPFFAEELVAAAGGAGAPRGELPAALADVLLARIERLSAATQRMLRMVSVAGRRVAHDRLSAVAAREDTGAPGAPAASSLDAELREAVAHHVLLTDDEGRYQFRHALLREAVYADLLPGERVRLHGRFAEQIAAERGAASTPARGTASALAYHSLASNDQATALAASITAADEAAALGAPATGLAHAEQALNLWDAVPADRRPAGVLLAELVRETSYLAATSGELERAVSYARLAVSEADALGDVTAAVRARRRLMDSLSGVDGHEQEINIAAEQAWRLVENAPPSILRARTLANRAAILRSYGEADAARSAAELAIAEGRQLAGGERETLILEADALTTLALLDDAAGDEVSAGEHLRAAVGIGRRLGSSTNTGLRADYFLALHHHDHGRLTDALAACTAALDAAAGHGLSWSTFGVELRVLLIVVATAVGDWDLADRHASASDGPESSMVVTRVAAARTVLLLGRGEFAAAQARMTWLREHWHRDMQIPLYAGCAAVELALWRGEHDAAAAAADELLAWLADLGETRGGCGVRICATALAAYLAAGAATGDERYRERVAQVSRDIEEFARTPWLRTGSPGPEWWAWLAVARAERDGDVAGWAAAVAAFDYGEVYRQATVRLRYAEALLAAGDRDAGTAQLRTVHETAQRLGAVPLRDAARALAGRLGADLGLGTVAAADDPLTPRERSVLELVATGRTNREVGAELFISEKTVSVHLSRAMGKLGVGRRAEAVAVAYDRGLLVPGDQPERG